MALQYCCRGVELLRQCLVAGSRRCARLLQRLVASLFQMKSRNIFSPSNRKWKQLWGGGSNPQCQVRVLLVGKRFTGKTALVYRLKLGAFIPTKPSVGSNTSSLGIRTTEGGELQTDSDLESGTDTAKTTAVGVSFCDVAGGDGVTLEWQGLQRNCDCVCFAFDSTAPPTCVEDARRELLELFYDEHFVLRRATPFLVIVTKLDLCNARSAAEIEQLLELPDEVKKTCQVFGCSALSGAGLFQVQQWLAAAALSASRSTNNRPHHHQQQCMIFNRSDISSRSVRDPSSFRERREELLGTFGTEAAPSSQAGPETHDPSLESQKESGGAKELQSAVLNQSMPSYPNLIDGL